MKYELPMNPADLGRKPDKDICSNCDELTGRGSDLKGAETVSCKTTGADSNPWLLPGEGRAIPITRQKGASWRGRKLI